MIEDTRLSVVIPAYKVRRHIQNVIARIGPEVDHVIVVDDGCPEESGRFVADNNTDPRVTVLFNERNLGVGGACVAGYREALKRGDGVVVKIDGDGQMPPERIRSVVDPVVHRKCDYAKGNRFFRLSDLGSMPTVRKIGNAALTLMSKLSSGLWHIYDPTNGFTAIHTRILGQLPLDQISKRYFFESDMLFWLGSLNAAVLDVPSKAVYGDEESNLKIVKVIPEFLWKHISRGLKRLLVNYLVRDFNPATVELLLGLPMFLFGLSFAVYQWWLSVATNTPATSGTVMIGALSILAGLQLLLSFLHYDMRKARSGALYPYLPIVVPVEERRS